MLAHHPIKIKKLYTKWNRIFGLKNLLNSILSEVQNFIQNDLTMKNLHMNFDFDFLVWSECTKIEQGLNRSLDEQKSMTLIRTNSKNSMKINFTIWF